VRRASSWRACERGLEDLEYIARSEASTIRKVYRSCNVTTSWEEVVKLEHDGVRWGELKRVFERKTGTSEGE